MPSFRRLAAILAIESLAVVLADQLTKMIVQWQIDPGSPIVVIPHFFHLVHWKNTGMAFGLFQNRPELLTGLGLAALVLIPLLFWWECRREPQLSVAVWGLGLILGGALGQSD